MPTKRSSTVPPNALPKLSASETNPVTAGEFESALEKLDVKPPFVIAVSGGADSMALLCLAQYWCKKRKLAPPIALTVDHGLRKESFLEARQVAKWAAALKCAHHTLVWQGEKPSSNIQAQAREARYRLLGEWLKAHRFETLLTGHTLDDQVETFFLRLARGSGLEGLSGIKQVSSFPDARDLRLARPLLGFSHRRLVATLKSRKQEWLEDPTNDNERFDRIRVRKALPVLIGMGLTKERIVSAVGHLSRARTAIDHGVEVLLADAIELSKWGYAILSIERFAGTPDEISLRALSKLLQAVGGQEYSPRFDQVEEALRWLLSPASKQRGRTLGGCRLVRRNQNRFLITREEHAVTNNSTECLVTSSSTVVWDRRFEIAMTPRMPTGSFHVRAVGMAGLKQIGKTGEFPPIEPRKIAAALPGVWLGPMLQSAPLLNFHQKLQTSARFIGLERLGIGPKAFGRKHL